MITSKLLNTSFVHGMTKKWYINSISLIGDNLVNSICHAILLIQHTQVCFNYWIANIISN